MALFDLLDLIVMINIVRACPPISNTLYLTAGTPGETGNLRGAEQVLEISNSLHTQPISHRSFTHPNSTNLTNDKYRLLYALPCQGKLDWFRHAGNLPIC